MHKVNNIRRFLAIAAVSAALLVVATVALRMHKGGSPKLSVRKLPVQVDLSLKGIHYTEEKQGVKRWDLSAERAEFNKKTDTTSLVGVRLLIAGGPGVGELEVRADRADYHNGTKDVALVGNVQGQSRKGMEFSTSRLTYVAARSQLETAEPVRFRDAGLELQGVGMQLHTQTRKFKLLKDVSAVYRPQGGR
jgi:lipopolysaccharide export system protein LptC